MKTYAVQRYECEICHRSYNTAEAARECESRPITQDRGVKIGDVVRITGGEGAGHDCKITGLAVFDREWGHYAWKRYWHTVGVTGDVIGGYGSRLLTWDQYEIDRPPSS